MTAFDREKAARLARDTLTQHWHGQDTIELAEQLEAAMAEIERQHAKPPDFVHPSNLSTVIDVLESERDSLRAEVERLRFFKTTSAADAIRQLQETRANALEAIRKLEEARARLALLEPVWERAIAWHLWARAALRLTKASTSPEEINLANAVSTAIDAALAAERSAYCEHGRPGGQLCPHCLGTNTATVGECKEKP